MSLISPSFARRLRKYIAPGGQLNSQKTIAEISFLLFILGGVVGLLNLTTTLPFGSGFEMVALATNLAKHGAFANPLRVLPTGPSAATPPLYPVFLALLIKVLPGPMVLLAAAVTNIVANAISAALLPKISQAVFGYSAPGIVASIFWLISIRLMPDWDVGFTCCALLFFVVYSVSTLSEKPGPVSFILSGILAGTMFLLNPMTLLVIFPWLVYLLFLRVVPMKSLISYCVIVLGVTAVMVFPWMLRNYHQLGSFVVRTSFGRTIYSSNLDCSKTNLIEDLHSGCAAAYEANFDMNEAIAFRDLGEVNYDHVRMAEAKAWIQSHPKRFLHLTFSRFVAFWFPRTVEYPVQSIAIWIASLLSIPGIIIMLYRREPFAVFTILTLAIFPLVYYVVVSDVRYRYPVIWLSFLSAGYFLAWLLRRMVAGAPTEVRSEELTR
jgi:hypothetical protein